MNTNPTLSEPLVSVIIPAYNAEAFIERTLKSVLVQTYRNLEVIVVDDGSKDQTAAIIKSIAQVDDRVIFLSQPNAGVAAARNTAIQHATGEFIAPIDADDIWYPDNIRKQVECFLQAGSEVGLVYSWSIDIDETDEPMGSFRAAKITGRVFNTLICHNFLGNASASMMRRSCLDQIGYYDQELHRQRAQGCEDWDLYLRMAEVYEFRVVPDFLVGYRRLTQSMSCDYTQMAKSHHLMLQTIQKNHPEIASLLFSMSRSILYMYFAQQSQRVGNPQTTFFWLIESVKAGPIVALIRYGFYQLAISSSWRTLLQVPYPTKSSRKNWLHRRLQQTFIQMINNRSYDRSLAVNSMIFVSHAFDQVIKGLTQVACSS